MMPKVKQRELCERTSSIQELEGFHFLCFLCLRSGLATGLTALWLRPPYKIVAILTIVKEINFTLDVIVVL